MIMQLNILLVNAAMPVTLNQSASGQTYVLPENRHLNFIHVLIGVAIDNSNELNAQ